MGNPDREGTKKAMRKKVTIIVDTREQRPFLFSRLPVEVVRAPLPTGDYSVPGFEDQIALERKSIDDLVGCLKGENRERFQRELARSMHFQVFVVLVEADFDDIRHGRYRSEMKSESVLQSLAAFGIRYGVSFQFCGTRAHAEYWAYSILTKFVAEQHIRYERLVAGQIPSV